jgi:hypothetical protein
MRLPQSFETLNQFAPWISAHYVDITKDRLLRCGELPPRRGVMHACSKPSRRLAPVSHSADGVGVSGHAKHPHRDVPAANPASATRLGGEGEEWLKAARCISKRSSPRARRDNREVAGSRGHAGIPRRSAPHCRQGGLEEFLIVSELTLASGAEPRATVIRSAHLQCPRCWRHQPLTAKGVCTRCDEALPA